MFEKFFEILQRQKTTFFLVLTGDHLSVSLAIQENLNKLSESVPKIEEYIIEIIEGIKSMTTDQTTKEVLS